MAYLLEPLKTKQLTLSNRLVMPPMATAKSEPNGEVNQAVLDYYFEKSRGGYISLIIIEHSFVQPAGKASECQLSVSDDSMLPDLEKLADIIHQNNSKCIMQINHAGSGTTTEIIGETPVGPSAIANPRKGSIPRELNHQEIQEIIEAFKTAALRVKQAGFDGVEIHSAHGYLLNQFFSPLTNQRTDEYGGDIYNRIRIHLQIIEAVRATVGNDFPIFLRLGAADYMTGGTTIEDSKIAVQEFEKAGVDILDISGGLLGYMIPGLTEEGYFAPLTEEIKKVVSIPVILTGGITKAEAAESLLQEGKANLVGVGRSILNDSNWAKQTIESLRNSVTVEK